MICARCQRRDHEGCLSPDCACGHRGSPVRPLASAERQEVRAGRLTATVLPRETRAARIAGGDT
ncbi:hypothetical protein [Actinomadura rupiterrae]|uniref:hypothetical protein n=1 Tax=Actinomadura rupiterrae TaxID=559627 RepID=UPI0020A49D74|nr:hypothetical protein [Actinomadura rupiterrae]MCP2339194.1 hypothetical protein [Actinomadura rupiterrae]